MHYDVIRNPVDHRKVDASLPSTTRSSSTLPRRDQAEIKAAVEALFGQGQGVNTLVRKGKTSASAALGKQQDVKKAIVTLVEGQSIDVTTGL
jgi:large subunit ribosomal protein L23